MHILGACNKELDTCPCAAGQPRWAAGSPGGMSTLVLTHPHLVTAPGGMGRFIPRPLGAAGRLSAQGLAAATRGRWWHAVVLGWPLPCWQVG